LMLLSLDPLTIWRLSAENATLITSLVWLSNRRVVGQGTKATPSRSCGRSASIQSKKKDTAIGSLAWDSLLTTKTQLSYPVDGMNMSWFGHFKTAS
jgi:hypothetical protein